MRKISYQALVLFLLALMYSGIVPAAETTELQPEEEGWFFVFSHSPLMAIPMARIIQMPVVNLETKTAVVQK